MISDAAIQSVSLVIIALFSMIGTIVLAFFQYRTNQLVHVIKTQTDGLTKELIKTADEKNTMAVDAATLAAKEAERERGAKEAETLEKGRRQGMEAAVSKALGPDLTPAGAPLPVTDNRVAVATEKIADAAEKSAVAAEKTADKA